MSLKKHLAPRFGALPEEWQHFSETLLLTQDLLPVVSSPDAKVSPLSKMKALGKTPSVYNREGHVVGFLSWTDFLATERDIGKWSKVEDYGMCIQTRYVRAIDVDIEDAELSELVALHIEDFLSLAGVTLPRRERGNSAKFLLGFSLDGKLNKRILRVEGGAIEFLANGQQFVACGMHTSGVRYMWRDGLPEEFPAIDLTTFEYLWDSLEKRFGIEKTIEYSNKKQLAIPRTKPLEADDITLYLYEHGQVISEMPDGRLNVVCPWKAEHTSESGETETQWFPAGTGGFEQGHFRCLHAHCAHRTDEDYLHETGYTAEAFDVIVPGAKDLSLPNFERNEFGKIKATPANIAMAFRTPHMVGHEIGFDEFRDEVMWTEAGKNNWRLFKDADFTRMQIELEQRWGFASISREKIKCGVYLRADEYRFDSAQLWLRSLKWDGIPRVESFCERYLGCKQTDYLRGVSLYWWSAMAGRVMSPGVQADMVPILVSPQGTGKTSVVRMIVPSPEHFMEVDLGARDIEMSRLMRGKLIGEIGELRGLGDRNLEAIKTFVSRTHENYRKLYHDFGSTFARRLLFVGTTNQKDFLADQTGERRWLPFICGNINREQLIRDREQLWAEGRELFSVHGVIWKEAQDLAVHEHADFTLEDPWTGVVGEWLLQRADLEDVDMTNREAGCTTMDILVNALGFREKDVSMQAHGKRLGRVLGQLGMRKMNVRDGAKRHNLWVDEKHNTYYKAEG